MPSAAITKCRDVWHKGDDANFVTPESTRSLRLAGEAFAKMTDAAEMERLAKVSMALDGDAAAIDSDDSDSSDSSHSEGSHGPADLDGGF